jgi:hypothetical protein
VNPVRLSREGEAALERLGAVKHVVRLGHYHASDDPYHRSRFAPVYWAPPRADASGVGLVDGGPSPVAGVSVFAFAAASRGEAALLVEQPSGNLLVSCDSIQSWSDTAGCSLLGGVTARAMGFLRERATIGPIWVKEMTGNRPSALRPDFERLLALEFDHLISAHGGLLRGGARSAISRACDVAFRAR